MRTLLRTLLSAAGVKDADRYGEGWTTAAIAQSTMLIACRLLRGLIYRVRFHKSAGIVLIGRRVRIFHARHLSVGRGFIAEDDCEIGCLSKRGITFGDKVTVGKFSLIRPTNYYGGELGEGLEVGNGSNIGPYSYIGCSGFINIGDNVMISPRVSIYAENHNFADPDSPMKGQGVTRGKVNIEDDCWIASHVVILADVTIGRGSVVAAGSVVTKDVPRYSIVAGVPARVVATRIKR